MAMVGLIPKRGETRKDRVYKEMRNHLRSLSYSHHISDVDMVWASKFFDHSVKELDPIDDRIRLQELSSLMSDIRQLHLRWQEGRRVRG